MKSFIIGIGTELIRGFILDTNGNYIAKFLNSLGVDVVGIVIVGDDKKMLMKTLSFAYENSDIIITTGGLGPTKDDITRECISEFTGINFVFSEEILEEIKRKFLAVHKEMPVSNQKQAFIPENGIVIKNRVGSAPGFIINKDGKTIISLPGVPSEMIDMLENEVKLYMIGLLSNQNEKEFIVRILGVPESRVDEIVAEAFSGKKYGTIADYGIVDVIFYLDRSNYEEEVREIKEQIIEEFKKTLGTVPTALFLEERSDISVNLRDIFISKGFTLSVAESMTGGYLSQIITKAPNASKYFLGSIVSYSEVAKEKALGVNRGNLQKYFATSPEVTKEMAENALKIFDSDISVAITGIAGPETDSSKREVGTTFISVSSKNSGTITKEFRLFGNREKIRFSAAMRAITMLIEFLSGRGTENEKG